MNENLRNIAEKFGTPSFVYNFDEVAARAQSLRAAFDSRFKLSYAMKCNPNPAIVDRLRKVVDRLDVSSGGELKAGTALGWDPRLVSFTGPGKRESELRLAVEHRHVEIVIESLHEAEMLNALAAQANSRQPVLLRIAPKDLPAGFGVNMAGKPSQFGIDEEDADAAVTATKSLPNLSLIGFHIYAGTQCLKPDAIATNYKNFINIFRRLCSHHEITPARLIFGSGLGIPYYEQDRSIDLQRVAEQVNPALDELRTEGRFAKSEFILELGRYLVGEAGLYLTRVLHKKRSRGADICICDGGMNHHLGACGHLGSVIHRNYRMFKVTPEKSATNDLKPYELVGPLCTSIDTLGHAVKFPSLDVGDIIAIHCSGAYGVTASPMHFISHAPPRELLIESTSGEVQIHDVSQFR